MLWRIALSSFVSIEQHKSVEFKLKFDVFQWCAIIIGGMIPLGIFCLSEKFVKDHKLISNSGYNLLVTLFIFFLVIVVLTHASHDRILVVRNKKFNIFKFFFNIEAASSIALIHMAILLTGGVKSSIFVTYYLYIVAAVGFAFGKSKELQVTTIFIVFSFLVNLLFYHQQLSLLSLEIECLNIQIKEQSNCNAPV